MKSQQLLNQVESLLVTEETLDQIKSSIKLIGKITLAIVLLVSAFIYFVISIFNKEVEQVEEVKEVTTVVTNVENVENVENVVNQVEVEEEVEEEYEISDEEWVEQFEVDAPELNLAYWHEETEELYHVEEMLNGGFGILFEGTWCVLDQAFIEDIQEVRDYVALPDGRVMGIYPIESILRTVCVHNYHASRNS